MNCGVCVEKEAEQLEEMIESGRSQADWMQKLIPCNPNTSRCDGCADGRHKRCN